MGAKDRCSHAGPTIGAQCHCEACIRFRNDEQRKAIRTEVGSAWLALAKCYFQELGLYRAMNYLEKKIMRRS
jgi:hypothetical protein